MSSEFCSPTEPIGKPETWRALQRGAAMGMLPSTDSTISCEIRMMRRLYQCLQNDVTCYSLFVVIFYNSIVIYNIYTWLTMWHLTFSNSLRDIFIHFLHTELHKCNTSCNHNFLEPGYRKVDQFVGTCLASIGARSSILWPRSWPLGDVCQIHQRRTTRECFILHSTMLQKRVLLTWCRKVKGSVAKFRKTKGLRWVKYSKLLLEVIRRHYKSTYCFSVLIWPGDHDDQCTVALLPGPATTENNIDSCIYTVVSGMLCLVSNLALSVAICFPCSYRCYSQ